jgi:hypothetical protein
MWHEASRFFMFFMHFMVNRVTMKSMKDMKKTRRSKASRKVTAPRNPGRCRARLFQRVPQFGCNGLPVFFCGWVDAGCCPGIMGNEKDGGNLENLVLSGELAAGLFGHVDFRARV